jgi:hypothetical protein
MMLASALKLAQQLGAADQRACVVTAPESDSDKAAAPILVGNARLALWSGERLLGTFSFVSPQHNFSASRSLTDMRSERSLSFCPTRQQQRCTDRKARRTRSASRRD